MTSIQRSLHYVSCRWTPPGGTLFAALSKALNKYSRVKDRIETMGPSSAEHPPRRLVNFHAGVSGGVAGSVIEWVSGVGQPILRPQDEEAEVFDPAVLAADKQQFILGIAYFYVRGNHVVLAPTQSIPERRIESHWRWLLQARESTQSAFTLAEVPSDRNLANQLAGVRMVELNPPGGELDGRADADASHSRVESHSLHSRLLRSLIDVLRDAADTGIHSASLAQALSRPDVSAKLSISYKGRMPTEGVPALDTLARVAAAIGESGYKVQLRTGEVVDLDGLKLRRPVTVRSSVRGQPDRNEMIPSMVDWLEALISSGYVRE